MTEAPPQDPGVVRTGSGLVVEDLRIVLETVRVILFGHRRDTVAAATAVPAVPPPALALTGSVNQGQAA